MADMLGPLADGELYLVRQVSAVDAYSSRMPRAEIMLQAMSQLIDKVERAGFVVTRGPEVTEFHAPEYPGDDIYVRVIAIGRKRD